MAPVGGSEPVASQDAMLSSKPYFCLCCWSVPNFSVPNFSVPNFSVPNFSVPYFSVPYFFVPYFFVLYFFVLAHHFRMADSCVFAVLHVPSCPIVEDVPVGGMVQSYGGGVHLHSRQRCQ